MAYDPASLKPGDVVLVLCQPTVLDWLISRSTACPFVHAAIVADGHLVESCWAVQRAPLDKYAKIACAYRVPGATDAQKQAAVAWAEGVVGLRYGVREILLDAERFDLHHIPKLKAPLKRWTCSGLVAQAYRNAGYPVTHAPFPAPADLAYSAALAGPRPWQP